jgi:hypothetical protein
MIFRLKPEATQEPEATQKPEATLLPGCGIRRRRSFRL